MPASGKVGPDQRWRIVIEVEGELDREHTFNFNKAIGATVQAAQTAGTPAKITFNKTVPKTREPGESPGER
jgi:hypothetical protein